MRKALTLCGLALAGLVALAAEQAGGQEVLFGVSRVQSGQQGVGLRWAQAAVVQQDSAGVAALFPGSGRVQDVGEVLG